MAAELSGESEMPSRRSRGSDRYVPDLPRGRMLSATFALVGERGYEGMTVRSVCERAGVSNRTFYECFSDREDCFLAAFNHAVDWAVARGSLRVGSRSWGGRRGFARR